MEYSDLDQVIPLLQKAYDQHQAPIVDFIATQTGDPFKVLIATILSARTKDATTTRVVKKLFTEVPDVEAIRNVTTERLEALCYPVGFFRQKARQIKKIPDCLDKNFEGEIPQTIDGLCKLPGVGRKTANLVMAVAFNKDAICVDVHVHRISNRFGLVVTSKPYETEMRLREKLPRPFWKRWNYLLVSFGQTRCTPRRPICSTCPIATCCPRVGVKQPR